MRAPLLSSAADDVATLPAAAEPVALGTALRAMLRHPLGLLADWNWKAGAISAVLHAGIFFGTTLKAGSRAALRATAVEALYTIVSAGLAGAVTQRLRHAVPRVPTALVVWVALPVALLLARLLVHAAVGTPHLRSGMIASFVFAALASGFNWFAMARGAFVTGQGRPFARDLLLVPRLLLAFVAAPFRWLLRSRD